MNTTASATTTRIRRCLSSALALVCVVSAQTVPLPFTRLSFERDVCAPQSGMYLYEPYFLACLLQQIQFSLHCCRPNNCAFFFIIISFPPLPASLQGRNFRNASIIFPDQKVFMLSAWLCNALIILLIIGICRKGEHCISRLINTKLIVLYPDSNMVFIY